MCTVNISPRARRALTRIPNPDYGRIIVAINTLANDPRPPGCKTIVGSPYWRIRIGNYRVIYEIDDAELVVTVIEVGQRGDVYR
ncbi:MAG: type II toxin-antitoxin system RelE/ParE family toxin [Herpetosiphon sp.]